MRVRSTALTCLFCVAAITTAGCDPGYSYKPLDAGGKPTGQWSTAIEGVRFEAKEFVTLAGWGIVAYSLDVANESDVEVEVLGAELSTKGRTFTAKVVNSPDKRTIVPRSRDKVDLSCNFESHGRASEVLGEDLTWVLRVRIGDKEHSVRVPMRRPR